MNVRRGGLGRGLGALIPTTASEDTLAGARFEEVPLDAIEPNPRQPREVFDETALAELVTSVREVGVLQPVVVRELEPGRYQLVMGERRWRASREAGQDTIPAIIRETGDDVLLRDALLENLHRQELNALEEAAAYQQLLEEFGTTHEELATRLGRSRSHVSNTIRLLNLAPTVQRRVAAGVLSAGHARALLALDSHEAQESLAARVVAEGMSVRAVEEVVAVGPSGQPPTRAARTRRPVAPALATLAELLSDQLETRVTIELGRRRGKLVVEFATVDDLERIVAVIAPDAAGLLRDSDTAGDFDGGAPAGPDEHQPDAHEHGQDEHGHDEHGHDEHGDDGHHPGHDEHQHDEHQHDEHQHEHNHDQHEHHEGSDWG